MRYTCHALVTQFARPCLLNSSMAPAQFPGGAAGYVCYVRPTEVDCIDE